MHANHRKGRELLARSKYLMGVFTTCYVRRAAYRTVLIGCLLRHTSFTTDEYAFGRIDGVAAGSPDATKWNPGHRIDVIFPGLRCTPSRLQQIRGILR
jgi:hypothetical protein